jgi:hypothetical protein
MPAREIASQADAQMLPWLSITPRAELARIVIEQAADGVRREPATLTVSASGDSRHSDPEFSDTAAVPAATA